jgi:hypothetical protein
MNLCIIDAWLPEESALVNSHWVAEQTVLALQRHHPDLKLGILASEDITPASVHAALGQEYEGFAYFGHGNENALRHNRQTIIGREQVLLLRARWFHAFACLSGEFLGQDALDSGAAAYLGYAVAVIVEWDPSQLPDELRALLTELVTAATLQLAGGVRSRPWTTPDWTTSASS